MGRAVVRMARAAVRPVLFMAVAAALASGGIRAYRWLLTSPSFMVKHVRVEGTHRATGDDVRRHVGVEPGTNIFRVGTREVIRDVESGPWIRSATVRRELPDTLVVRITEHEPKAAVLLGHLYLADANGRLFKRAGLGEVDGLVIVTGLDRVAYLEDRETEESRIRDALAALDAYRRPGRPKLSEVSLDPGGGLTLYTYSGAAQFRLGKKPLAEVLPRLDLVLAALGPDLPRARSIHLDGSARRVAVRLSADPAPATDSTLAAESMR